MNPTNPRITRARLSVLGLLLIALGFLPLLAPGAEASSTRVGPDEGYTIWGAFENADGSSDVVFLTGGRVQSNGRASFAGSYGEGSTVGGSSGMGLKDADTAVVRLLARSHGAYDPAIAHEQVTTAGGGCDVALCATTQYALFVPDGSPQQTGPVFRTADDSIVAGAWAVLEREEDGIRFSLHTRFE